AGAAGGAGGAGAEGGAGGAGGEGGAGGAGGAGGSQMSSEPQQRESPCGVAEACYIDREASKCMAAGTKAQGEACERPNDCAAGLQCFVVCTPICSIDGSHAPACADCPSGVANTTISPDNNAGICLTETIPASCDIFAQDDCPAGEGCYSVRGGHACTTAGVKPAGSECSAGNECVPGTLCISGACLPYCRDSADTPMEHRCDVKCPNENLQLVPELWGQGACTNVEPTAPCDFWAQDCADENLRCLPTVLGESCASGNGQTMLDQACSDHADCGAGLVCPRELNVCRPACSIEPFVNAMPMPLICADDCPNGVGQPIEPDSRIGYCP
ncbi:MAG: dickkopf-related protein, partial [Bradymonadia bacterium]